MMSFGCKLTSGSVLAVDIIFVLAGGPVNIQINTPNENLQKYFNHALAMIVNL